MIKNSENTSTKSKTFLLLNHWVNANQTYSNLGWRKFVQTTPLGAKKTLNQSLPLQNQWANFKPNIDVAKVFKESLFSFKVGDFGKKEKIHRRNSGFFSETLMFFFFTKHDTERPLGMGMHVRLHERRHPRGNNMNSNIFFSRVGGSILT